MPAAGGRVTERRNLSLCVKLPESKRGLLIYSTNEHEVKEYLAICEFYYKISRWAADVLFLKTCKSCNPV